MVTNSPVVRQDWVGTQLHFRSLVKLFELSSLYQNGKLTCFEEFLKIRTDVCSCSWFLSLSPLGTMTGYFMVLGIFCMLKS